MAWYSGLENIGKRAIGFDAEGKWNPINDIKEQVGLSAPQPTDLTQTPDAQRLRGYAQQLLNERNAHQYGTVTGAPTADQSTALALQQAAAQGNAPSRAEQLYRAGTDEAAGKAMGAASSFQGSNPGAALRAGITGASNVTAQNAAAAAALRADEMAKARDAYMAGSTGIAGQGINANLNQQGINNAYNLGSGNLALSALESPLSVQVANEQLKNQANAANMAGTGQLFGLGGTLLAGSDERMKTDIHPAKPAADAFLESLKPKSFEYRNPEEPGQYPGKQLGVIAQDMLGGVKTGPDGKKWISADVIGRVLAGMGRLNERLDGVEGKRG